jgi:hypothetical protein
MPKSDCGVCGVCRVYLPLYGQIVRKKRKNDKYRERGETQPRKPRKPRRWRVSLKFPKAAAGVGVSRSGGVRAVRNVQRADADCAAGGCSAAACRSVLHPSAATTRQTSDEREIDGNCTPMSRQGSIVGAVWYLAGRHPGPERVMSSSWGPLILNRNVAQSNGERGPRSIRCRAQDVDKSRRCARYTNCAQPVHEVYLERRHDGTARACAGPRAEIAFTTGLSAQTSSCSAT